MEHPIVNPPNPYVGVLRIFPGTLIKIAGKPRVNATRFAINFQTGPSLNPRDDLALHLSPCFTPPRIIRNSLQSGAWGLEEAWGNGAILSPHSPFEIIILAEQDQFKIAINGSHYCEFRYRIPYHHITHLTIDGDVDVERISVSSSSMPAPQPSQSYQPSGVPYPSMPMPPMYPNLQPGQAPPTHYPSMPGASGPAPMPANYASGGYPQAAPYPPQPHGSYPPMAGGPAPAGGYYQGGYPQPQSGHSQPAPSSSSIFGSLPFGNKALGTVAGLAAGAAVLSVASNPIKAVKKIMKPHKAFKHKGWGKSSSSSSNSSISSKSSFSSNSS